MSISVGKMVTLREAAETRNQQSSYLHLRMHLVDEDSTNFAMPQVILNDALALDSINKTALPR